MSAGSPSVNHPPRHAFETLSEQPADSLLALIKLFREDPRPEKIDLGVGVYRNERGATPVFGAVKEAEQILLETQPTKAYLGPEGDPAFVERLAALVFGEPSTSEPRRTGVQTPGGTGALRLAADLLAKLNPRPTIWIGTPTWPNHEPVFAAAGLPVERYRHFDAATQRLCFAEMLAALGRARAGDVVLLQGCCHNPTGADLDLDQWREIAELLTTRRLIPLVDLAYQGLGIDLDSDIAGTRLVLAQSEEALIAYSCDKNAGLYRERTGALFAQAHDARAARLVHANLLALARANWSMPPDHGAAVVRTILEDADLSRDWRSELATMQQRIAGTRRQLAAADPRLAPLGRQMGLFSLLPITPAAVATLRHEHGIYMAGSGRINVAGLQPDSVAIFVAALAPHLPE